MGRRVIKTMGKDLTPITPSRYDSYSCNTELSAIATVSNKSSLSSVDSVLS